MKLIDFNSLPNTAVAAQGPLAVTNAAAVTLKSLLSGAAFHAKTQFVRVRIEDAPLRAWTNGSTPTSTAGRLYDHGDEIVLPLAQADNCKLIATTATNANLQVEEFLA